MRRMSAAAVGFVLAAIFAIPVLAQPGGAQPTASGKIGLVNTSMFLEDKPGAGITRFKNAVTSVDNEFKTVNDELKALGTRYQNLGNEINKMRNTPAGVPIDQKALEAKATEFQDLETEIKRKQEDAKAKYERRYGQVVGPIYNDILRAMSEFAKKNGYSVLLDGARLEEAQILLGFDEKYDVTKDFITFYNARPAGAPATAAATPPRP